ncbi:MAG: hypothetical protein ACI84E_002095, partial [Planctomycetota bacterium]
MTSSQVPDSAPLDESGSMMRRMIVGVLFGVLVYAGIVL